MSEARHARRSALRRAGKAINKADRSMRGVRRDFFEEYGIDFDELRRQAATTRRDLDLCLHDDDVRRYASASDEAADISPDVFCGECGKLRLRIPIVAPAWLAEMEAVSPAACEAFMRNLFK